MRIKRIVQGLMLVGITSVVSGCNLEMSNKTQVGQYNDTVLSRIEMYSKIAEEKYTIKADRYKELITNNVEFVKEYELDVRELEEKHVEEFKAYSVLRHDFFTAIENENVREVIVLNGTRSKMYVNMIWDKDGKLIYIDRKVISNG